MKSLSKGASYELSLTGGDHKQQPPRGGCPPPGWGTAGPQEPARPLGAQLSQPAMPRGAVAGAPAASSDTERPSPWRAPAQGRAPRTQSWPLCPAWARAF